MINPTTFRELVSGQRRGLFASLIRLLLRVIEIPYTWAVQWRNRRYDRNDAVQQVRVPVVSVGNLTLGGTGKTPMIEWLARWFTQKEIRVVIVSRGYGSQHGTSNDEARELAERLPGVAHVQDADRIAAAREAIIQHGAELILLDDGFQHRRLGRDLDIVLIDALEPLGFNHVFPRGTLREPPAGLARANVVALSRSDMLREAQKDELRSVVSHHAPGAVWCELTHSARHLLSVSGEEAPLEQLAGKPIAGFCGIGNPAGFRHTLDGCGYEVAAWREFPDHFSYNPAKLAELETWVAAAQVEAVVCTHKDLVKINSSKLGGVPLWAVSIELDISKGTAKLEERLLAVLAAQGD